MFGSSPVLRWDPFCSSFLVFCVVFLYFVLVLCLLPNVISVSGKLIRDCHFERFSLTFI